MPTPYEIDSIISAMDSKIWGLVAMAKRKELTPINLRLSPAAETVMRMSRAWMDMMRWDQEKPTWRDMQIIVEGSLSELMERRSQVRICVEARAGGDHGRYHYFDADCSDLPEVAMGED